MRVYANGGREGSPEGAIGPTVPVARAERAFGLAATEQNIGLWGAMMGELALADCSQAG